jgi:hypothetical protein
MNLLLKLGETIENCKKHLFNQGYSYEDASQFVELCFNETKFNYNVFDEIPKEKIKDVINYLNKTIIN